MNKLNVMNAVAFQVVWFACVLGGARGISWWGFLAVLLLAAISLNTRNWRYEVSFALGVTIAGMLLDSVWHALDILRYNSGLLAPPWIALLWTGVALSINFSLSWFRDRPRRGALLAGTIAPFSYTAGAKLGAVEIPGPWYELLYVAGVWCVVFWVLFKLGARLAHRYGSVAHGQTVEN